MSIKMNIHRNLRHLTNGRQSVNVKGNTVGQCLKDLVHQFPDIKPELFDKKGKLLSYVDIYVNLESSYPEELAKAVHDEDEITITLMLCGG